MRLFQHSYLNIIRYFYVSINSKNNSKPDTDENIFLVTDLGMCLMIKFK